MARPHGGIFKMVAGSATVFKAAGAGAAMKRQPGFPGDEKCLDRKQSIQSFIKGGIEIITA